MFRILIYYTPSLALTLVLRLYKCRYDTHESSTLGDFGNHIHDKHRLYHPRLFLVLFVFIMILYLLCFLPWWSISNFEIVVLSLLILTMGFTITGGWYHEALIKTENLVSSAGHTIESKPDEENSNQAKLHALIVFPDSMPDTLSSGEFKEEKKSNIFKSIFGFLASLSITNALVTYYTGYIKTLSPNSSNLLEIIKQDPLPSLELIIVFVVAIPMTHMGYIFLSNVFIKKSTNWKNNTARGVQVQDVWNLNLGWNTTREHVKNQSFSNMYIMTTVIIINSSMYVNKIKRQFITINPKKSFTQVFGNFTTVNLEADNSLRKVITVVFSFFPRKTCFFQIIF